MTSFAYCWSLNYSLKNENKIKRTGKMMGRVKIKPFWAVDLIEGGADEGAARSSSSCKAKWAGKAFKRTLTPHREQGSVFPPQSL
jgi:hypothetical protein